MTAIWMTCARPVIRRIFRRMAKGWAQGLTAAIDQRIARSAAAHRGLKYVRRTPPELCAWRAARREPVEWTPNIAYAVGLIATDGCLLGTGRHIAFTSKDLDLIDTFLLCVGKRTRPHSVRSRLGSAYRVQFSDVLLYRWLQAIGLSRRKSLTLGGIDVPEGLLGDVVRGLLDGDGSILHFWYRGSGKASPHHVYERLLTKFNSASRDHVEWLRNRLTARLGIRGCVTQARMKSGNFYFTLAYAKRESCVLLSHLYADPAAPRLERKWRIWDDYRRRYEMA